MVFIYVYSLIFIFCECVIICGKDFVEVNKDLEIGRIFWMI